MKNKATKVAALSMTPAVGAFEAFFSMLDLPAAVCDGDLRVLVSNAPFDALCGVKDATGKRLSELLPGCGQAPDEGMVQEWTVECGTQQSVTLALSKTGNTVAVIARHLSQVAAAGQILSQARAEKALLDLGREVALSTTEEALLAVVARGVKAIFPGRYFCVRILEPRSGQLTSLYAEGELKPNAKDTLILRKTAAAKTQLNWHGLSPDSVQVTEGELPLLFQGSVRGLCAPLVAAGQLFGAIHVEYPEGLSADLSADDRTLIQLANHVAVGVRNAKLIEELTFVRKYLEELLEHANALILVADRERRVVVFNKALAELTGFSKDEVMGKDVASFLAPRDQMRVLRLLSASLRGEKVSNFETRVMAKSGQAVRISFATSTVLTSQGDIEGVIAIGQDLTRIKELESQVIQAEKLASLGQLAASVVHEINNPMTAVLTYADALLKRAITHPSGDGSELEKYRKIVENSERVLRFTRDLVSYARPTEDKHESLSLQEVLIQSVGFCDHVLKKHQVTVGTQFEAIPPVSAVRKNLVQVFINLITNACHAMTNGGVLHLQTRLDGAFALVEVRDEGVGIPFDLQQRIFEPFFTTKPDGRGTGLGLSIVSRIVESHGGTVSVESQMGVGTSFLIRFPLEEGRPSQAGSM